MEMCQILKQLVATLIVTGLVTMSPSYVFPANRSETTVDDAAELMLAASQSLPNILQLIEVQKHSARDSLRRLIELDEQSINQHKDSAKSAGELISTLEAGTGSTAQPLSALKQNQVAISATLTKQEEALKKTEETVKLISGLETTRRFLEKVSRDLALAKRVVELIRSGNPAVLLVWLKKEFSTSTGASSSTPDNTATPTEVREAKDNNGLILIFRSSNGTHCLSTKLQCSGKSYSFAR